MCAETEAWSLIHRSFLSAVVVTGFQRLIAKRYESRAESETVVESTDHVLGLTARHRKA